MTALADSRNLAAEVAAIPEARERLAASAAAMEACAVEVESFRQLRFSLIYVGVDRFSVRDQQCGAAPSGRRCSQEPNGAFGLCKHHYQQWRNGVPWGEGGLSLQSEPATQDHVGWRKRAIEISEFAPGTLQQALESRIYPAQGGGWAGDAKSRDTNVAGFWRMSNGAVIELPEPPLYPDERTHWTATGEAHREAMRAEGKVEELRAIRQSSLEELFEIEPSNKALAELARINANEVYKFRAAWKQSRADNSERSTDPEESADVASSEHPAESVTTASGSLGMSLPGPAPGFDRPYERAELPTCTDQRSFDASVYVAGVEEHHRLCMKLLQGLSRAGLAAGTRWAGIGIDVAWLDRAGHQFIAEVKSCHDANECEQLRLGLGQIIEYRERLSERGVQAEAVLLVSTVSDAAWYRICGSVGVQLLAGGERAAWQRLSAVGLPYRQWQFG